MNFSKIRMMFFDFDDTLLIHYREQKLDATADAQALYVDDYYEALNEAAKEGFTVMTVQELMLRQYTAEQ